MLIEQSNELKLRRPGPLGRTCTYSTGYFHGKTKISKENLRVEYYLLLNYCKRQCTLFPLKRIKSRTVQNLTPKC